MLKMGWGAHSKNEKIHESIVYLSRLEHTLRPDSSPNHGGVVHDFGSIACKSLGVRRLAELGDMAQHPSENCRTLGEV